MNRSRTAENTKHDSGGAMSKEEIRCEFRQLPVEKSNLNLIISDDETFKQISKPGEGLDRQMQQQASVNLSHPNARNARDLRAFPEATTSEKGFNPG